MNLLAGSTGFLGNEILKAIGIQGIPTLALSRRPIVNLPSCADELIIDFNAISELEIQNINHLYLSLGYPLYFHNVMGFMNKVLKEDLFLVDFTYQLEIAKKAKEAGAQGISLISAVGSNSHSRNHYLKTKGMLESEIMELDFESKNIYQPGHLRGNKSRPDILFADAISIFVDPFMFGSLSKFRSISAKKLAEVVASNSLNQKKGINYYTYSDFI